MPQPYCRAAIEMRAGISQTAQVDYDAQIRVPQAMMSELFDTTIYEGRDRLVRRIAPKLFSTQREIFDQASASVLGRTPLERTLVGVGVSSLNILLLGGLPR